ncbi:MAG: hypothetical protein H6Q67_204 [Firmicutes bacterium]|nr:hypothetical protein [Bacillota bacterium]
MRKIWPAVALAMVHIAGDNLGVVPALAVIMGSNIYWVVIFAYILLGSGVTAIAAWIGCFSGLELGSVVNRLFGLWGKRVLAVAILGIAIPASAVTGGYFSGQLFSILTGISFPWASLICLVLFSLLAAGWWRELLLVINYISFLLLPMVVAMLMVTGEYNPPSAVSDNAFNVVLLVLALLSYNSGGMRPAVVAEASVYLAANGYRPIIFAVVAKLVEGFFTLLVAYLVFTAPYAGPLELVTIAELHFNFGWTFLAKLVLFCVLTMTMIPAMMVNARQVSVLTGLEFKFSLLLTGVVVYFLSLIIPYQKIVMAMSGTGLLMMFYLVYIAYVLHKSGLKK